MFEVLESFSLVLQHELSFACASLALLTGRLVLFYPTQNFVCRLMPSSIYDLLETRGMSLEQAEVLDLASDITSGLTYIHGQRRVQCCEGVKAGFAGARPADLRMLGPQA